jgi:hypothetical protein
MTGFSIDSTRKDVTFYSPNEANLNSNELDQSFSDSVRKQAESIACLFSKNCLIEAPEKGWQLASDNANGLGTAFLVGERLVLTAASCLYKKINDDFIDDKFIETLRLVFGFQNSYLIEDKQVYQIKRVITYRFRGMLGEKHSVGWVDWALLELDRKAAYAPLKLNMVEKVADKIVLYTLGHPLGLPIRFMINGSIQKNEQEDYFECNLESGRGSPVFDKSTGQVIGILCSEKQDVITDDSQGTLTTCQRTSALKTIIGGYLPDAPFELILRRGLEEDPVLQEEVPNYISLDIKDSGIKEERSHLKTVESCMEDLLASEKRILLITGSAGSGKTFSCKKYALEKLADYSLTGWLVVFISLSQLKDPFRFAIEEGLASYGIAQGSQIEILRKRNVLWILDGYDQVQFQNSSQGVQFRNLYLTNQLSKWPKGKFIFTCREGYPLDLFTPILKTVFFSQVSIVPFTEQKILEFIRKYSGGGNTLVEQLRKLGVLHFLANPCLLQNTIGSLSMLIESQANFLPFNFAVPRLLQLKYLFKIPVWYRSFEEQEEAIFQAVLDACQNYEWEKIEQAGQALLGLMGKEKITVLHALLQEGNIQTIKAVLVRKLGPLLSSGRFSQSLQIVLQLGKTELLPLLAEYILKEEKNQKPLLFQAIEAGDLEVIHVLVKQENALQDKFFCKGLFFSAAQWAIARGEINAFALLILHPHFSWIDSINGIGNLLHIAVHFDQIPALEYLLTRCSDGVRSFLKGKDHQGRTPLLLAAFVGNTEAISLLFEQGASLVDQDKDGNGVLHLAVLSGNQECVAYILSLKVINVNAINTRGKTPAKLAIGSLLKVDFFRQQPEVPNFSYPTPHNLVFHGGITGGASFSSASATLFQIGRFSKDPIKRVAGGAVFGVLAATLFAFGFEEEILDVMLSSNYKKNFTNDKLIRALQDLQAIKDLWKAFRSGVTTFPHLDEGIFEHLWGFVGCDDGEHFRKLMEEAIKGKTKIPFCTFGELYDLIEHQGYPFKHLHLFGTKIGKNGEMVHFSSEDPRCKDLVISDVVRIALSAPGLFKPHRVWVKRKKERVEAGEWGTFIATGFSGSELVEAFDRKCYTESSWSIEEKDQPIFNRHTLAVCLSESSGLEKESERLLMEILHICRWPTSTFRKEGGYNANRVIWIHNELKPTFNAKPNPEAENFFMEKIHHYAPRFMSSAKCLRTLSPGTVPLDIEQDGIRIYSIDEHIPLKLSHEGKIIKGPDKQDIKLCFYQANCDIITIDLYTFSGTVKTCSQKFALIPNVELQYLGTKQLCMKACFNELDLSVLIEKEEARLTTKELQTSTPYNSCIFKISGMIHKDKYRIYLVPSQLYKSKGWIITNGTKKAVPLDLSSWACLNTEELINALCDEAFQPKIQLRKIENSQCLKIERNTSFNFITKDTRELSLALRVVGEKHSWIHEIAAEVVSLFMQKSHPSLDDLQEVAELVGNLPLNKTVQILTALFETARKAFSEKLSFSLTQAILKFKMQLAGSDFSSKEDYLFLANGLKELIDRVYEVHVYGNVSSVTLYLNPIIAIIETMAVNKIDWVGRKTNQKLRSILATLCKDDDLQIAYLASFGSHLLDYVSNGVAEIEEISDEVIQRMIEGIAYIEKATASRPWKQFSILQEVFGLVHHNTFISEFQKNWFYQLFPLKMVAERDPLALFTALHELEMNPHMLDPTYPLFIVGITHLIGEMCTQPITEVAIARKAVEMLTKIWKVNSSSDDASCFNIHEDPVIQSKLCAYIEKLLLRFIGPSKTMTLKKSVIEEGFQLTTANLIFEHSSLTPKPLSSELFTTALGLKMPLEWEFRQLIMDDRNFQMEFPHYIVLSGSTSLFSPKQPVESAILEFLQSSTQVMLITGPLGSGKSFFSKKCAWEYLNGYDSGDSESYLPIFIPLARFSPKMISVGLIDNVSERYEIRDLQNLIGQLRGKKILWMLDGYDELSMKTGRQELNTYLTNQLQEWPNSKMMVTCRGGFCHSEMFKLQKDNGLIEFKLNFSFGEIMRNHLDDLKTWAGLKEGALWKPHKYKDVFAALQNIGFNLEGMIQIPFLYKAILIALPCIEKEFQERLGIDSDIRKWLEMQKKDVVRALEDAIACARIVRLLQKNRGNLYTYMLKIDDVLNYCMQIAWAMAFFGKSLQGLTVSEAQAASVLNRFNPSLLGYKTLEEAITDPFIMQKVNVSLEEELRTSCCVFDDGNWHFSNDRLLMYYIDLSRDEARLQELKRRIENDSYGFAQEIFHL